MFYMQTNGIWTGLGKWGAQIIREFDPLIQPCYSEQDNIIKVSTDILDKYLDLSRKSKNTIKHEGNSDISHSRSSSNNPK